MKITNALLEKYAQGLCTPEEVAAVEAWLLDPGGQVNFPIDQLDEEKNIIWDSIQSNLKEGKKSQRIFFRISPVTFRITAASVIILCVLTVLFLQFGRTNKHSTSSIFRPTHYVTKVGEKKRISLIDGTVVMLNSESKLHISEDFARTTRCIILEGEAYLEVAKDSVHPFELITDHTRIRVLGTKFNVKAYPDEKLTTVVVREGKVQFSSNRTESEKVILTENERGQFSKQNGLIEDNVYADSYLHWVDNKLNFNNEEIRVIARAIERWYGVKIKLDPKVLNERFTGEFHNQSVKYVVDKICYVMNYSKEFKHDEILIYKDL